MKTCTTIVQSLSLLTLLCLEVKQMQNLIYYCFISPRTHRGHTIIKYQDTDNCLPASLVAQKIALKPRYPFILYQCLGLT